MTQLQEADAAKSIASHEAALSADATEFLTVTLGNQMFCVPVLQIQDVLGAQKITRIPLSQPEVAGSLNLRGRIVTAIDTRKMLGIEPSAENRNMNVVVEHNGELYSLIVDAVGVVLAIPNADLESNPATLDAVLKQVSAGVYRLDDRRVLIMDVSKLLETGFEEHI